MLKKVLLLAFGVGIGSWIYLNYFTPKPGTWQSISPGIEWRKIQMKNAGFLSSDVEVIVLRFPPKRLHVKMGKTQTAKEWRESTQSIAAINGGFFDEDNDSLGLRESNGKELSALRRADWGVFFIRDGKAHILHTRDFPKTNTKSITEAIQSGPRLVVDGKTTDLKEQWARRTGIGINADGKVLIAVSNNELSLRRWAEFWASKDGLHCQDALNLDGGGSTQLSLKSDSDSLEITGSWPVPDALVIR